jgi:hypothetical protein
VNVSILDIAEREEWDARQRLRAAGALILDTLRRLLKGGQREHFYQAEAKEYRAWVDSVRAKGRLGMQR